MSQNFSPGSSVTHRFMLASSYDGQYGAPLFFGSYDAAFHEMIRELASAVNTDPEWLIESADESNSFSDGLTFSFSRVSARAFHEAYWEIFCVAIETDPHVNITFVENWPDADIAPELYRR